MNEAIILLKRIATGSSDAWARGLARQAVDALASDRGGSTQSPTASDTQLKAELKHKTAIIGGKEDYL